MNLFILLLIVIVILTILCTIYIKQKNKTSSKSTIETNDKNLSQIQLDKDLFITVNELTKVEKNNKNELIEITNTKILTRINDCFPHIGQLILNSQNLKKNVEMGKQINNFNHKYAGNLYEAVIPSNAKLFDSKAIPGAVRGSYLDLNKHTKQANFLPVDSLKPSTADTAANLTANAMNITSMVVGQYYMSQIDDKLENIKLDVSDIKNFLDDERIAKISQLVVNVSVIIKHQQEISFHKLISDKELDKLYDYEEVAGNILTHVNKDILNILEKETIKSFDAYKKNTNRLTKLLREQEILMKVMNQICSLKYILYHGLASSEYCYERFNIALNQSSSIKVKVKDYQEEKIKVINIDLEKGRYKKSYFLDNVVQPIIEKIDDNRNYTNLENDLLMAIKEQINNKDLENVTLGVYEEDTKLLIGDGKVYYERKI